MMQRVRGKLLTAGRIFCQRGFRGIGSVTAQKIGMWYRRTGNAVRLDGCVFDLEGLSEDISGLLLRGEYELSERTSARIFLDQRLPVIELGSCIGVVSCITNRMLQHPDRHVVLEANPNIIETLRRNAARNRSCFTIVNAALGYDASPFFVSNHLIASGTRAKGTPINVPKKTLRQIADEFQFDRFTLVCDIEGSEIDLVDHEGDLIAERCPWVIMETHEKLLGMAPIRDMTERLAQLGFSLTHRAWDTSVFCNSLQKGDANVTSRACDATQFARN